jgi:hypothetical protein
VTGLVGGAALRFLEEWYTLEKLNIGDIAGEVIVAICQRVFVG